MATVAVVTLPSGVSVVLISISSLKIARASARSSAEAAGNELCANAPEQSQALATKAERATRTIGLAENLLRMRAL